MTESASTIHAYCLQQLAVLNITFQCFVVQVKEMQHLKPTTSMGVLAPDALRQSRALESNINDYN